MIGYAEIKDFFKLVGPSAGLVILVVAAFAFGLIPSQASLTREEVTQNSKMINLVMDQHAEQMSALIVSLREICLNTAKTDIRERACADMHFDLSQRYLRQR
jgi:hypothetical protein